MHWFVIEIRQSCYLLEWLSYNVLLCFQVSLWLKKSKRQTTQTHTWCSGTPFLCSSTTWSSRISERSYYQVSGQPLFGSVHQSKTPEWDANAVWADEELDDSLVWSDMAELSVPPDFVHIIRDSDCRQPLGLSLVALILSACVCSEPGRVVAPVLFNNSPSTPLDGTSDVCPSVRPVLYRRHWPRPFPPFTSLSHPPLG